MPMTTKRRSSSWDPGLSFDRDREDEQQESEFIVPEKCQNDLGVCGDCGEKSCKKKCKKELRV